MPHKYDIESDQLKCNFCTQWFKCTLYFANLQRYSLKACPRCLQNFNYTILHPETHKILKVMLIDTNIIIPRPGEEGKNAVFFELQQLQQEVKDQIGKYFQEKMKGTLEQMKRGTKMVQISIKELHVKLAEKPEKNDKEVTQITKEELQAQMGKFRDRPVQHWLGVMPPLKKDTSAGRLTSRRKLSQHANKQNQLPPQGWGKTIKSKVGVSPKEPLSSMKSSVCLPYFKNEKEGPLREQSPLLNASFQHRSAKKLGLSTLNTSRSSQKQSLAERDLAEIMRLLESAKKGPSYMPYELQPDNSIIKLQSKRTQADAIIDLRSRTGKGGQLVQLIGADVSKVNFPCYLKSLGHQPQTKVVRVIKTAMSDYEFDHLLRFISEHQGVQTLIVTNNRLTELSLVALVNFLSANKYTGLRQVYMGSNRLSRDQIGGWLQQVEAHGVQLFL